MSYGPRHMENRNLPSFVVITEAGARHFAGLPRRGAGTSSPACHSGDAPRARPGPGWRNVKPRVPFAFRCSSSEELDLLAQANRSHLEDRPGDASLEARIRSFETAFGMRREMPEVLDLGPETEETLHLYGLSHGQTTGFGWQCLFARQAGRAGVRFIELIDTGSSGNWDSHGNMAGPRPPGFATSTARSPA